MLTTQPEPGDPRESMHQAAIKNLGLIEDELRQKSVEKEATHQEQTGKGKNRWKRRQHTKNRQEKEGESPNLCEPEDPLHLAGKITRHKGRCTEYHHTSQGKQVMLSVG
jgi:hypothetical protein